MEIKIYTKNKKQKGGNVREVEAMEVLHMWPCLVNCELLKHKQKIIKKKKEKNYLLTIKWLYFQIASRLNEFKKRKKKQQSLEANQ